MLCGERASEYNLTNVRIGDPLSLWLSMTCSIGFLFRHPPKGYLNHRLIPSLAPMSSHRPRRARVCLKFPAVQQEFPPLFRRRGPRGERQVLQTRDGASLAWILPDFLL